MNVDDFKPLTLEELDNLPPLGIEDEIKPIGQATDPEERILVRNGFTTSEPVYEVPPPGARHRCQGPSDLVKLVVTSEGPKIEVEQVQCSDPADYDLHMTCGTDPHHVNHNYFCKDHGDFVLELEHEADADDPNAVTLFTCMQGHRMRIVQVVELHETW